MRKSGCSEVPFCLLQSLIESLSTFELNSHYRGKPNIQLFLIFFPSTAHTTHTRINKAKNNESNKKSLIKYLKVVRNEPSREISSTKMYKELKLQNCQTGELRSG